MLPMKTIFVLLLCRVSFIYFKLKKPNPRNNKTFINRAFAILAHQAIVSFSETRENCDERKELIDEKW